jgi:phosphoribosylformylglycinamidine cyclo-ligase
MSDALAPGDEIVLVASTGLHANGASLARSIADELSAGYATLLPSGRSFGDALLDPALIYVPLVRELLAADAPVTYLSHITGHGLLKIMRPQRRLTYRLSPLPPVPEVLSFLVEQAAMDPKTAFSTLNMGVGFAVYCRPGSGDAVVSIAERAGFAATVAGQVEEGPRRVLLEPAQVTFESEDMVLSADNNAQSA